MAPRRGRPGGSRGGMAAAMTRGARRAGGLAAGGTGVPVAVAAAIGHSTTGLIIAAVAAVLSTAIVVVVPEWFRLQALRQPGRDLRQLIQHTSVQDATRLWPELQSSYPEVLGTRGATADPGPTSAVTTSRRGRGNDGSGASAGR